ncbi:MAG: TolB protein [Solirubrobacteraceae bacterium]|nr:TolB protein [Solirubrobacteraceae bacterium]
MMRKAWVAAVGAVVLSGAGGGAAQAQATQPSINGTLAYAEETFDAPSVPQLRTVDPFGTAQPASFGDENACCGGPPAPAWSHDGTRIAFVRPTFGTDGGITGPADIWTVDADLGTLRQITSTPDVAEGEPSWSPDDRRLAYVAGGAIRVLDLATGASVRLSPDGVQDDEPAWSPAGDRIAFTRSEGSTTHVYVMDARPGAPATRLTSRTTQNAAPAWSPDARRIAFASFGGPALQGIWVMRSSGRDAHRLTRELDFHPTFSPDGRRIAFSRPVTDPNLLFPDYLWRMTATGAYQRRVLIGGEPVLGLTPDWGRNAAAG